MTVPLKIRLPEDDVVSAGEDGVRDDDAWRAGEAWRPRLTAVPNDDDGAPQIRPAIIRREVNNVFRRPAPEASPPAAHSPRPLDDGESRLTELAALLEERQREREARHRHEPADSGFGHETFDRYEPSFETTDALRHEPHVETDDVPADEFGERFGWTEREPGDDVRQYLEGYEDDDRRRGFAVPLLRIGGVVVLSAAAAMLAVFVIGSSDPAVDDQPTATAIASSDEAPAGGDAAPAAALAATGAADALPGDAVPAAGEQRLAEPAEPAEPAAPAFASSDIRTILPAPQQSSAAARGNAASELESSAPAAAGDGQTAAEPQAPAPSWISPEPVLRQRAEPQTGQPPVAGGPETQTAALDGGQPQAGTPSAVSSGQPAQVTVAVNMRSGPDNEAGVLTVIPANAAVDLIGCDIWCEVVYDNRQGWVYRDFVVAAE